MVRIPQNDTLMFAAASQLGRTRTWVLVSEHKSDLKAKHKELYGTESTEF